MIYLKTKEEIKIMNKANKIVLKVLDELESNLKEGITTKELDNIAENVTEKEGAVPAFKNYYGYPASVCISINDGVVHGIPSDKVMVTEGDVVSLDYGVQFKGYYGDAARTCIVGDGSEIDQKLIKVTKESLNIGIERAQVGLKVSDISKAIESYVVSNGFSVVKDYVGHGIGKSLHEEPQVPNYYLRGHDYILKSGMVIAIEPMVNEGTSDVTVEKDGWTVRTKDGKNSAHFEYSVAIAEDGPIILGVAEI